MERLYHFIHLTSVLVSLVYLLVLTGCQKSYVHFDDIIGREPVVTGINAYDRPMTRDDLFPVVHQERDQKIHVLVVTDIDQMGRVAVDRHQQVRALKLRIERLKEVAATKGYLADPVFSIGGGQLAETAAGQAEFMASLSQKIEWPGEYEARKQLAMQYVYVAEQDLEHTKRQIKADVADLYWQWVYQLESERAIQSIGELLVNQRDVVKIRIKTKPVAQADWYRLDTRIHQVDQQLVEIKGKKQELLTRMNRLMSRSLHAPIAIPPTLEKSTLTWQQSQLLDRMIQGDPTLKALQARMEMRRQELRLARLDRLPDLTLGVSFVAIDDEGKSPVADGEDQLWVSGAINLPIWQGRREAQEEAALRGMGETLAQVQDRHQTIHQQLESLMIQMDTRLQMIELFDQRLIPSAQQTVDASLRGYATATSDIDTLLTDWDRMLKIKLLRQQQLIEYNQRLVELAQMAGVSLNQLVMPQEETPAMQDVPSSNTQPADVESDR